MVLLVRSGFSDTRVEFFTQKRFLTLIINSVYGGLVKFYRIYYITYYMQYKIVLTRTTDRQKHAQSNLRVVILWLTGI